MPVRTWQGLVVRIEFLTTSLIMRTIPYPWGVGYYSAADSLLPFTLRPLSPLDNLPFASGSAWELVAWIA